MVYVCMCVWLMVNGYGYGRWEMLRDERETIGPRPKTKPTCVLSDQDPNSNTMYDTYVSKHCLTSRKMINILTGVTAMFVGGGGLFLY